MNKFYEDLVKAQDPTEEVLAGLPESSLLDAYRKRKELERPKMSTEQAQKFIENFDPSNTYWKEMKQSAIPVAEQGPLDVQPIVEKQLEQETSAAETFRQAQDPEIEDVKSLMSDRAEEFNINKEDILKNKIKNVRNAQIWDQIFAGANQAGAGLAQVNYDPSRDLKTAEIAKTSLDAELLRRKEQNEKFKRLQEGTETDIATRQADPSSEVSTFARDFLKKTFESNDMNIPIPDSMSFADIQKQFPSISNLIATMEARKGRAEIRQQGEEIKRSRQDEQDYADALKFQQGTTQKILASKPYQALKKQDIAVQDMENALRDPSALRDINIMYRYISALDPESVVREGELKLLGPEAQTLGQQIRTMKTFFDPKNRRRFTQEQVQKALEITKQIRALQEKAYAKLTSVYANQMESQAKRIKDPELKERITNPANWMPDYEFKAPTAQPTQPAPVDKKQYTFKIRAPNGQLLRASTQAQVDQIMSQMPGAKLEK